MEERLRLNKEQQHWLQVMENALQEFEKAGGKIVLNEDTEEFFAINTKQVKRVVYIDDENDMDAGLEVMDDTLDELRVLREWSPLWSYTQSLCVEFE